MSHGRLAKDVLLAAHTVKPPRGRARTGWHNYIFDLAWCWAIA